MKEAPYLLREVDDDLKVQSDNLSKLTSDSMPVGTVREFMVSLSSTVPIVSERVAHRRPSC